MNATTQARPSGQDHFAQCIYCNAITSAPTVVLQGSPGIGVCQPCLEHMKSATPVQRFAIALQGVEHTMREFFNAAPLSRSIRRRLLRDALDDAGRDLPMLATGVRYE